MGRILLLFLIVFFGGAAYSEDPKELQLPTPFTRDVGDYKVSIGVMPISHLSQNFPRSYDLLVKHHGKPDPKDTHHLAVSVWKEEKGGFTYLSNFKVEAEVRSPLLRATRKELTKYPHQYGDNYGGWFEMSDKGLYHITVIIHEKGRAKRVDFDYLVQ